MDKAVQIRIKVPNWDSVLQYIEDYINSAEYCFAFHHNLPDNNHYHIYLFNTEVLPDSIRKKLYRYLDKQNYAVSTTAGKKKILITQSFAYQYGTTNKLLDPCYIKGYNEVDIQTFKDSATAYYGQPKDQPPIEAVLVTRNDNFIIRPDHTWEKLVSQIDKYQDKSIKQIKSMISVQWINEGKAIPRPSDLHRYAVSIFYRMKYFTKDWNYTVPDWALESEYN